MPGAVSWTASSDCMLESDQGRAWVPDLCYIKNGGFICSVDGVLFWAGSVFALRSGTFVLFDVLWLFVLLLRLQQYSFSSGSSGGGALSKIKQTFQSSIWRWCLSLSFFVFLSLEPPVIKSFCAFFACFFFFLLHFITWIKCFKVVSLPSQCYISVLLLTLSLTIEECSDMLSLTGSATC